MAMMTNRLSALKTVLWALVGVLAAITLVRFWHGLGAVTNLSDSAPWGLWIGFDVMAGVALAAGGFAIAATVYVFHLEQYRRFVRPVILTAWLGYVAVAVGLVYDLGLPWNIWHPAIYPQHHSVLFEVAMCVILYLAVLTLEFAPVILEHPLLSNPWFAKILRALKRITVPLVVAGIVLSTLHQSSLGSLFLITPYRLHPLWYSPIIYLLFFLSAVGLGLMTVILESLLAAYFLHHRLPTKLLGGLGFAGATVIWTYSILRLGDLAVRGVLTSPLDAPQHTLLFVLELSISAIIPATLLLSKKLRSSVTGLAICASLVVLGMIWYRLNVCFIAFARPEGMSYSPSWMEIAVSLGIVAGGTLIFLFFVERFKVYEYESTARTAATPSHDAATLHGLLPNRVAAPRRYSFVTIAAAVLTIPLLPVRGVQPTATPTLPPRTLMGVAMERGPVPGRDLVMLTTEPRSESDTALISLLTIDGNRDGTLVLFAHDDHVERQGNEESCLVCHHLNMPYDRATSCYECHRDMYESSPLFDHTAHVRATGGRRACSECHLDHRDVKTYTAATSCSECHEVLRPVDPLIEPPDSTWRDAVSYREAMHGLCIACHERSLDRAPDSYAPALAECAWCHDADRGVELRRMTPRRELRGVMAVDNP